LNATYLVQFTEGGIWKWHMDHLQEITDTPQDQSSLVLPAANPTAESEVEMPEMPNSSFDAGSSFPHRDFCRKTFARDYNRI